MAGLVPAALGVTLALAIGGGFAVSFSLGTTCTDDFSCGTASCAPCATQNAWVIAGVAGQLALAAAVVMMVVLGGWFPRWRRSAQIASWVVISMAIAWFTISTVMARLAF